jgi:HopA1 effector protein family
MIDGTFRLHPAVELVVFDRLGVADQARVAALTRDPAFYGLLITGSTTKAVDRDSALLLLTLREPGPIPRYARQALGDRAGRTIMGWVLDGILEVERGGAFVTGVTAVSLFDRDADGANGVIGRLSVEAIRYGASLPRHDLHAIARRLYRYNHQPLTPPYARTYDAETDDVRLGLAAPRVASVLARYWTRVTATGRPWVSWVARASDERGTFKLYVSPAAEAVREVFPAVVTAVTPHRPCALKVGRGVHGLLRPDKMVVYFARRDDLHGAAQTLAAALAGALPHGTPFTSAVTADGLLSWGVDPTDDEGLVSLLRSESWRERLCNQIAAALVTAPDGDRVPFVLARLEAHGVDVRTWSPAA